MSLIEALSLLEEIYGVQVDPPSVSRAGQRWTPEEERLLLLTMEKGKDQKGKETVLRQDGMDDSRIALLTRTVESLEERMLQLHGATFPKASLSEEECQLGYQWRHLKAAQEPMRWQQGDRLPRHAWEPGPGDVHLIVVGNDNMDAKFRPLQLGAAQVDLAASAIRQGVEIAMMDDRPTWHEHVRKGVNRTLRHLGTKAPRNSYRSPEQLRTTRVLALGPAGFTPAHLDRLPAHLGIIAVTVAPSQLEEAIETHDPARRVTRYHCPRLNETGMTLPITWRDLPHIPDEGTVSTYMTDVAIRFIDVYVRRSRRFPSIDDATLQVLLAPQDTQTVVGLLVHHFQKSLRQWVQVYREGPNRQISPLVIQLEAPPDDKVARWVNERARQTVVMEFSLMKSGGALE